MPFLKRSAHISLSHHAALAGMEYGISRRAGFEEIERYHDMLIYPALIQAGVHRFKVMGDMSHKSIGENKFVASRIDRIADSDYYDSVRKFEELFREFLVCEDDAAVRAKIFLLANFLAEITMAMKFGTSVVYVLPIPRMEDYYGILSLEILMPIGAMISKISSVDVLSPIPQLSIIKEDVSVLMEVVDGAHFERYSKAHEVIEYEGGGAQAFQDVACKAVELKDKFGSTLDVKKMAISFLPTSSALVDIISGGSGVVGKVLGLISEPLAKYLGDKSSIIIYDYAKLHEEILTAHYCALRDARVNLEK
ncbi:MAG TPA: hypothetical protein VGE28_09960 [Pseudomonas sp.]